MTNISSFESGIEQQLWLKEPSNLRELLNKWGNLGDSEKFGVMIIRCPIEYQAQIVQQMLIPKKEETTSTWPEEYKFSEPVSDACLEFADCHGLNEVLEQCFHAVRMLFSKIESLSADLDRFRDEDTEDIGHIVIKVKVGSSQRVAMREYDSWVEWLIRNLTPSECTRITLTISRV
jgi:hypothetical protein